MSGKMESIEEAVEIKTGEDSVVAQIAELLNGGGYTVQEGIGMLLTNICITMNDVGLSRVECNIFAKDKSYSVDIDKLKTGEH